MRRFMAVALLSTIIMLGTVGTATPAQAHFERGANAHIENVSRYGVVTFRITNRIRYAPDAEITIRLRFNNGTTGWYRATLNSWTWDIFRWRYPGNWTRVWITHVHVRPLYDY